MPRTSEPKTSDPLSALLAHNLWATRLILERCRGLSSDQFLRPFPIGPADHGGLHAILTHIIGAMRRWADRIGGATAPSARRSNPGDPASSPAPPTPRTNSSPSSMKPTPTSPP